VVLSTRSWKNMFLKLKSISPSSNGVKMMGFFFLPPPSKQQMKNIWNHPTQAFTAKEKWSQGTHQCPSAGLHKQKVSKTYLGRLILKHTHTRFNASEIWEMPQNVWNPSKLMALYVGALRKHWKTRRFREGFNFLVPFPKIKIDYLPHVVNHGFGPPKLYWPNLLTGGVF